jgi:ElaB/YqjD/DUF883 family membrane-anchored ribosome-binding protein
MPRAPVPCTERSSVLVRMVRVERHSENGFMRAKADERMSVEKAMSRVLSAESDALAQIAACQSRADETLQSTRKKIRAMLRRTQQRIVRLHAACEKRTHELVSSMEQEAAEGDDYPTRDNGKDTLLEAVRAVAAELTTPGSADGR